MKSTSVLARLALPLAALAIAALTAGLLGYGSHWLHGRAVAAERQQMVGFRNAQAAHAKAQTEDADFRASANRYQALIARGIARPEDRLLLTEWLNGLKAKHQLIKLSYALSPQRPLALAGNPNFPAITPQGTRIVISLDALHEGDALAFVDAIARDVPGFLHVTECNLGPPEASTAVEVDNRVLRPRVAVTCALEWITVKERAGA